MHVQQERRGYFYNCLSKNCISPMYVFLSRTAQVSVCAPYLSVICTPHNNILAFDLTIAFSSYYCLDSAFGLTILDLRLARKPK